MLLKKMKFEFIGTFLITIVCGIGGFNLDMNIHPVVGLFVSLFLTYSVLIWISSSVFYGQFNPMITLAMILTKHNDLFEGLLLLIL